MTTPCRCLPPFIDYDLILVYFLFFLPEAKDYSTVVNRVNAPDPSSAQLSEVQRSLLARCWAGPNEVFAVLGRGPCYLMTSLFFKSS
jgi:hypothetical protein